MLSTLAKLLAGVASRWRNVKFRLLGVQIHGYCWLRAIEIPRNWSQICLQGPCSLDRGVTLLASGDDRPEPKLVIESGVYINRFTMLDAHESIVVCSGAMIGPNCYITDSDHGIVAGVPVCQQPMQSRPVRIGRDAWLGAGVIVTKGVTIGDGAVIGAGSVVTRDIPANTVAVGVPARVIRERHSDSALQGGDR